MYIRSVTAGLATFILILQSALTFAQGGGGGGGGGCTSISNGSCASAIPLTPGASCVDGSTCGGGSTGTPSACIGSGYECSWYSFTATASAMYVSIAVTAQSGCYMRSEVFGGSCGSLSSLSCMSGAPLDDLHSLTGLTIGATYYVQICYAPGGPCGNGGWTEFCIEVGEPDPPCNVCSTPCGTASGYPSNPTVQQVVDDCQTSPFVPALQPGSTHTFCYNFTATATSVNFNVIITSNCGGGNVTNFSWQLYNATCGAPIQTGTLASLTFSPVVYGNDYVFCYTFTVPSTCTHSQHCPYFVGATVLPVTLASFDAEVENSNTVSLNWLTASELNNDYFTIERSLDGIEYETVTRVEGAGSTTEEHSYATEDVQPYKGKSYYRLKQTDFDGQYSYSEVRSVQIARDIDEIQVIPNPVNESGNIIFQLSESGQTEVIIRDIYGNILEELNVSGQRGFNSISFDSSTLSRGIYFIEVRKDTFSLTEKFIKE